MVPLEFIFLQCLETGKLPTEGKRASAIPVYKKDDKKILKSYCPVSPLPVSENVFEKLIFNGMFRYFTENFLISSNQSEYKPGGSCINQVLSIAQKIYKYLNCGYVFLDNSKTFC